MNSENFEKPKRVYEMNPTEKRQWCLPKLKALLQSLESSNEETISQYQEIENPIEDEGPPYHIPTQPLNVNRLELLNDITKMLNDLEDDEVSEIRIVEITDYLENMDNITVSGKDINPRTL